MESSEKKPFKPLERLLDQLWSDSARAQAIAKAMPNYAIPQEYVEKMVLRLETEGKTKKALSLARKAGLHEVAIELYEKNGMLEEAAEALKIRQPVRAQVLYERKIKQLEEAGCFEEAAILEERRGDKEKAEHYDKKAMESYEKKGMFGDGARVAEKRGWTEKARELYWKREEITLDRRLLLYETLAKEGKEMPSEELMMLYFRAGKVDEAAHIADALGQPEKAMELYETAGKFGKAAEWGEKELENMSEFNNGLQRERAQRLRKRIVANYRKAQWNDAAVTFCLKQGIREEAICILEDAERLDEAAKVAEEGGDKKRALQVYENAGNFWIAKIIASRLGFEERAKEVYKPLEKILNPTSETTSERNNTEIKNKRGTKKVERDTGENIYRGIRVFNEAVAFGRNVSSLAKIVAPPLGIAGIIATGQLSFLLAAANAGRIVYHAFQENDQQEIKIDCFSIDENKIEGKFCRTARFDEVIAAAEKQYQIPEGMLGGIAMIESYGEPFILNTQDDGSAGLFQIEPEVALEHRFLIYDPVHAKTGSKAYGKALREFVREWQQSDKQLETIDERFNVEKSADIAAKHLTALHEAMKESQKYDKKLAEHDAWDLAVAAYAVGREKAHGYVNRNGPYVGLVRQYQQYYVTHKE